mgnify:CR=1 FL=1|jgi:hypothetical protein
MAPTVTYWLLRLILKTNGIRQLIVFIDKLRQHCAVKGPS